MPLWRTVAAACFALGLLTRSALAAVTPAVTAGAASVATRRALLIAAQRWCRLGVKRDW